MSYGEYEYVLSSEHSKFVTAYSPAVHVKFTKWGKLLASHTASSVPNQCPVTDSYMLSSQCGQGIPLRSNSVSESIRTPHSPLFC